MSSHRRGRILVSCSTAVAVAVGWTLVAPAVSAHAATVTFTTDTNWQVPPGVTSVNVVAIGGGGGASSPVQTFASGGSGAIVTATMSVTPGQILEVGVGRGGTTGGPASTGSTGGGGGGGASLVYQGGVAKIIAGGGGGAGGLATPNGTYPTAHGGRAGAGDPVYAGAGGGGDNGGIGGSFFEVGRGGAAGWCCGSASGGTDGGGTSLAPGMGGSGGSSGSAGSPNGGAGAASSGNGGDGATSPGVSTVIGTDPGGSGGGGGGGYGGGGGAYGPGGGGGGGSYGPTGRTFETAGLTGPGAGASVLGGQSDGNGEDGQVTFTYTQVQLPGAVSPQVSYPSSGALRGRAVISWRPAARATGYQTRIGRSRAHVRTVRWSAVQRPTRKVVQRTASNRFLQVRAVNSRGAGAPATVIIRRR